MAKTAPTFNGETDHPLAPTEAERSQYNQSPGNCGKINPRHRLDAGPILLNWE
jgi:hypothetical protein